MRIIYDIDNGGSDRGVHQVASAWSRSDDSHQSYKYSDCHHYNHQPTIKSQISHKAKIFGLSKRIMLVTSKKGSNGNFYLNIWTCYTTLLSKFKKMKLFMWHAMIRSNKVFQFACVCNAMIVAWARPGGYVENNETLFLCLDTVYSLWSIGLYLYQTWTENIFIKY